MESGGTVYLKATNDFGQGRDVKTFFLVEGRFMKTYTGCFSQGDEWGDESHGCSRNLWAVFGWLLTIDVRQARSHAEIVRTGVYAIKLFQRSIDCNTDMVEGVLQRHTIPCLVRNISKPKHFETEDVRFFMVPRLFLTTGDGCRCLRKTYVGKSRLAFRII